MLLLGAINNYHFGKRAARLTRERGGTDVPSVNQLERGFYRSVVFEASLGVIVLLVTAVLVFLTPARNHPAMESGTAVGQQR
jgi:putative copper export protein